MAPLKVYSLGTLHQEVRTINVNPATAPEGYRIVKLDGTYAATAAERTYGITIADRYKPGVLVSPTQPAAVALTAYARGARFTLTAAQAVNAGGRAGVYQVNVAFTPTNVILPVAEAANVFFVGAALVGNVVLDSGSTTPVFNNQSTYQRDNAVCRMGIAVVEAGGVIAAGAAVTSDTQGRGINSAAGTDYVIGTALDAATGAGDFIRVEVNFSR